MSNVWDQAKAEMDEALEVMNHVHTPEERKAAQETFNEKKTAYFDAFQRFREETFRNADRARMTAQGVTPSFARETDRLTHPPPRDHPRAPGDKPLSPLSDEYKVWGCPECGSKNVNWKGLGGRKAQRAYIKRWDLDKSLIIDGNVRHCITCSQELKRDVLLKRMSLDEITEIKTKIMDKKAKEAKPLYKKKAPKKPDEEPESDQ